MLSKLENREKSLIHYKSFDNFFRNIDFVKDSSVKNKIYLFLEEYVLLIEKKNDSIDRSFSNELSFRYLFVIGDILTHEVKLVHIFQIKHLIIYSIIIDMILFLTGVTFIFNLPIPITLIFTGLYYFIHLKPLMKSHQVFGLYY